MWYETQAIMDFWVREIHAIDQKCFQTSSGPWVRGISSPIAESDELSDEEELITSKFDMSTSDCIYKYKFTAEEVISYIEH